MIEQPLVGDIEYLRTVNLQLAEWEMQGPHASRDEVAAVLDEQFRFRRAKGGAVDRDGFLDGLTDGRNRSDEPGASGKFRSSGTSVCRGVRISTDSRRECGERVVSEPASGRNSRRPVALRVLVQCRAS
jgi:hypothetical protein